MNNAIESMIPVFGIIFTFGIPGILIFWWIYIKHKERTKLMDMGLSPQEASDYFKETERRPRNPFAALKWGILLSMVGLGLLVGMLLEGAGYRDSLTGVTVLLFAGIGFIIYYLIVNSKLKNDKPAPTNTPQS